MHASNKIHKEINKTNPHHKWYDIVCILYTLSWHPMAELEEEYIHVTSHYIQCNSKNVHQAKTDDIVFLCGGRGRGGGFMDENLLPFL